jgi:hypothetical protein
MEKEAPAAIRWVAASGSMWLVNDVWFTVDRVETPLEPLVAMLGEATEDEHRLAQRVLESKVQTAVENGSAAGLLAKIPGRDADDILARLAGRKTGHGEMEKALQFAALVTPERRIKEVLPDLAAGWLASDPESALKWIHALPPAERRAALSKTREADLSNETRAALRRIIP